ncbi:hypothetical protein VTN00DRAFT_6148 [Thermoascus crustaceus]|uniref:uncharacterized protein n=1 Tax=Thermoascus crustaceus TaxID=5088 RepID=UPI00374466D8
MICEAAQRERRQQDRDQAFVRRGQSSAWSMPALPHPALARAGGAISARGRVPSKPHWNVGRPRSPFFTGETVYLWKLRNLQPQPEARLLSPTNQNLARLPTRGLLRVPDIPRHETHGTVIHRISKLGQREDIIYRYLDGEHIYEPIMRVVAVMSRLKPNAVLCSFVPVWVYQVCVSRNLHIEKSASGKTCVSKTCIRGIGVSRNQGGRTEIKCKKKIMESHESPVTS